jgi:hypothetical protein
MIIAGITSRMDSRASASRTPISCKLRVGPSSAFYSQLLESEIYLEDALHIQLERRCSKSREAGHRVLPGQRRKEQKSSHDEGGQAGWQLQPAGTLVLIRSPSLSLGLGLRARGTVSLKLCSRSQTPTWDGRQFVRSLQMRFPNKPA